MGATEQGEEPLETAFRELKEETTKNNLLSRFIDATFQGSAAQLIMEALGNNTTTKEELDKIKALIQKIENQ